VERIDDFVDVFLDECIGTHGQRGSGYAACE
jgi:hypothetical protein